jgi:hypothetical protein
MMKKNEVIGWGLVALVWLMAFLAAAHAETTSSTESQITKIQNGGTSADMTTTGGTNHVLKQSTVGEAITTGTLACADLSNASPSCSTDATNASNVTSGIVPAARLGTGTANSTTVLHGDSTWGSANVGSVSCSNLTNAATSCSVDATNANNITTGTFATARLGTGTANSTTYLRGNQTWGTPSTGVSGFTSCTSVSSSGLYSATAYCTGDYHRVAGACISNTPYTIGVWQSHPVASEGYYCNVYQSYPSGSNTATAVAYCCH